MQQAVEELERKIRGNSAFKFGEKEFKVRGKTSSLKSVWELFLSDLSVLSNLNKK